MREGPEHGFGWRERFDVDGVVVEVLANHHKRSRIPRGHEIARQMARGGMQMVDEVSHEWRAIMSGHRPVVIRPTPSGNFTVDGRFHRQERLEDVVRDWAKANLARADAPGIKPPIG